MKAIFLDIDGILNCYGINEGTRSQSHCGFYMGIDKDKTRRLARIVEETGAILILSSTWKVGWEPKGRYKNDPTYDPLYNHAKYLDNHLKKKGGLVCVDKTRESNLADRGLGIRAYLASHPEITEWIVLDDEIFRDFERQNIMPHLVKVNPNWGLLDSDADAAIKMLKGEIIGPYKGGPVMKDIGIEEVSKVVNEKAAGPNGAES